MNQSVQTEEITEIPASRRAFEALWTEAMSRLRSQMSDKNFEMWLDPIEAVDLDGDLLVLRAPNITVRSWFEQNYGDQVVADFASLGRNIRIAFAPDRPEELRPATAGTLDFTDGEPTAPVAGPPPVIKRGSLLPDRYLRGLRKPVDRH